MNAYHYNALYVNVISLHLQYWRLLILLFFFSLDDSASVLRLAQRSGQYHFRYTGTCVSSFFFFATHLPYVMRALLVC